MACRAEPRSHDTANRDKLISPYARRAWHLATPTLVARARIGATFLQLLLAATAMPRHAAAARRALRPRVKPARTRPGHHVRPGDSIQQALEKAARDPVNKTVFVHAGTYRPQAKGQALIWFNARHDGITLQAVGDVVLTAANPQIADSGAPSHPAVVNHVVYFGDGISPKTVLRGFKITGANNFTTGSGERSPIESDDVRKTLFFYSDGGGIKIYARSYPTIEQVEVYGNYTSPCGGGVSVEHLDQVQEAATFRNCIFRNNRTQTTGSRWISCTAAVPCSRIACSSATSPTWASTTSACSPVANTIRRTGQARSPSSSDRVRRSAGARSPATGTASTTAAAAAPTSTAFSGRTTCQAGSRRASATRSTSSTAAA